MKYIEGLSTVLSDSVRMKYIEGLSTVLLESIQMKYIGGLSIVLSESVKMKYIRGLSTVLSESFQMKYIGGWSNILSESVQRTFVRTKTKPFVLEIIFIHGKIACVRESMRTRGMELGIWHSCRKLHNFYLNGNEFREHGIACALRWGVALVRDFLY